jgi:hypothetical protein
MKRPIRIGAQAIRDAALLAAAILFVVSVRFERAGAGLVPQAQAAAGNPIPAVVAQPASAPDPSPAEPCPRKASRFVVSRVVRCEAVRANAADLTS